MNEFEIPDCVCDLCSKPANAIYWCCTGRNCKYKNQSPASLEQDFDGDFIKYFNSPYV